MGGRARIMSVAPPSPAIPLLMPHPLALTNSTNAFVWSRPNPDYQQRCTAPNKQPSLYPTATIAPSSARHEFHTVRSMSSSNLQHTLLRRGEVFYPKSLKDAFDAFRKVRRCWLPLWTITNTKTSPRRALKPRSPCKVLSENYHTSIWFSRLLFVISTKPPDPEHLHYSRSFFLKGRFTPRLLPSPLARVLLSDINNTSFYLS